MENEKDHPTIVINDHPKQKKIEVLKEKLRYKQALRENAKKIDHKLVRLNIQADALPTKTFFIMNALAAVIAGYGLLANSSAVVIGAMLVAMMLGPISAIALSFIDNRWILFVTALKTLVLGVMMIFGIGVVLGLINFNMALTHEILSRTQPNVIDLMIALAGGAAGAFAAVSPRLSVAVVGVAVATALVPPLVASGILLAHWDLRNSANAFLLAFTNIVAIQISSSLVLWIAGFRRGSDEEVKSNVLEFIKRNVISLLFLLVLTVYLTANFLHMIQKQMYETKTKTEIIEALNKNNNIIDKIQFDSRDQHTLARVVIQGDTAPSSDEIKKLNQVLPNDLKKMPTIVQIRFIPVQIIQAHDEVKIKLSDREAKRLITK
ncbi:TIGR00341 family protein [Acinetobacter sp. 2JN-4]|uniref:TIGR00341 family protein n=1 Tax=Acinetobacter sp. 2JN-4 TaxID=2479844 RepID=UPI000EF9EE38|nr:TIGR00341 family protein [Acinetobacter sp. 2JN-4]RLZ08885.1 TIGR00341 family protein [Acinetobacter sp. 2JN-4]